MKLFFILFEKSQKMKMNAKTQKKNFEIFEQNVKNIIRYYRKK